MRDLRGNDRGDSLVEVLAAIAILGIAAVAIMSGLALSASISGKDRGQSTSTTEVRNFAEYIASTVANGGYRSDGQYTWPSKPVAVVQADCLTKASATTATPVWNTCPVSPDGNLQRLKIKATADNGLVETLTIFVRKPCGATSVSDTC